MGIINIELKYKLGITEGVVLWECRFVVETLR